MAAHRRRRVPPSCPAPGDVAVEYAHGARTTLGAVDAVYWRTWGKHKGRYPHSVRLDHLVCLGTRSVRTVLYWSPTRGEWRNALHPCARYDVLGVSDSPAPAQPASSSSTP
jgi:hypothetical protein